jgi:type IV secretory pathway component VirB8
MFRFCYPGGVGELLDNSMRPGNNWLRRRYHSREPRPKWLAFIVVTLSVIVSVLLYSIYRLWPLQQTERRFASDAVPLNL